VQRHVVTDACKIVLCAFEKKPPPELEQNPFSQACAIGLLQRCFIQHWCATIEVLGLGCRSVATSRSSQPFLSVSLAVLQLAWTAKLTNLLFGIGIGCQVKHD